MKKKFPLLLAIALLTVGCGVSKNNSSSQNDSSSELSNSTSLSNSESSLSSANSNPSSAPSSSKPSSAPSSSKPSSSRPASSSRPQSSSSSNKPSTSSSTIDNPSTIIDPETGEEIDLNGYIEVAYEPNGSQLSDWTDDMKAIFVKYLHGVVPPFIPMDNLLVSYDNLGILQAKGTATSGIARSYETILDLCNYASFVEQDGNKTRLYGRGFGDGFLISIDGLEANGIFSINFDYDIGDKTWPAQDIQAGLSMEMFGGTSTVIPPYEYEDAEYYTSISAFGEIDILCLKAPSTCVQDYSAILENNHWDVKPYGDQGMYTAMSRDKLVVMVYYYDGTGLQINIGFGEGENYTTWNDCIAAMNDFGRTELRLTRDIGSEIPAIDDAELYEIDRTVRGSLQITAYKTISYKVADVFNYVMAAASSGAFDYDVRGDYYWLLPKDKSYAIRLELNDYESDTLSTTTLVFTLHDYRIYLGAVVYYGNWPTLQVATIAHNIGQSQTINVPEYNDPNSVLYAFSDYQTTIRIEIFNPSTDCLATYKAALLNYSYTIKNETAQGYEAIDRTELAKITVTMVNGEMIIKLEKNLKSTAVDGKAMFNFENTSQLVSSSGYITKTWSNSPVSFTIEKGSSTKEVGNVDYLAKPLRIYKGQKVTISTSEGYLTKLEFYVTDKRDATNTISYFDARFLSEITITGATLESYNQSTGLVRFTVDANVSSVTFDVAAPYMSNSSAGFGLTGLDVYYVA